MIEDISGEVYIMRLLRGGSEVAVKVHGGKVVRFPVTDDERFEPGEPVKLRLIRE